MPDLDTVLFDLYPWSYFIIGLGVMIENAGIPVPGETIMIAASILSAAGKFDPYLVAISGATGAIIGDNMGYWLGKIGGRKLFKRLSNHFPYIDKTMKNTEMFFKRYGGITVFLARFIAGVRIFAGPVAGISLMEFKKFFLFNATGAIVWASVLVFGIMHLGRFYIKYIKDYQYADYALYGLLCVVLLFLAYKTIKKIRA
ncbi:MAG: DedA family protein [bacterium]